tara:strand:+ start:232 stop:531 length:300 start_codon:yes stop_codon:yes gene_type:complete
MSKRNQFEIILLIEKHNQIGLAPKLVYELHKKYMKLISDYGEAFYLYCESAFSSFPHEIQNPKFFQQRYDEYYKLTSNNEVSDIKDLYEQNYEDNEYRS